MPSPASINSPPTETDCPAAGCIRRPARKSFIATCLSGVTPNTAQGFRLKKVDPACEDLLLWEDGSVAAGVRQLGRGLVFNLGSNSSVLPFQVLEWLHVKKVPIAGSNRAIMTRHFVSNNGLYDIWVLWNTKGEPATATFTFREGCRPAGLPRREHGRGRDSGRGCAGREADRRDLGAWETRAFLSPRGRIDRAPVEWFALQRSWWSGTADPGPPIPAFESKLLSRSDRELGLQDPRRRGPGDSAGEPRPGRPEAGRLIVEADADRHL